MFIKVKESGFNPSEFWLPVGVIESIEYDEARDEYYVGYYVKSCDRYEKVKVIVDEVLNK